MPAQSANRVYIDDHCDHCGEDGRMGVSFGYQQAVICFPCLEMLFTNTNVPLEKPCPTCGAKGTRGALVGIEGRPQGVLCYECIEVGIGVVRASQAIFSPP